jgi:hypothetical protein
MEKGQNRLQKALEGIIWALAATVEARDPYTAGHQERVTNLSLVVASEMQLPEDEKQKLRMAAMVHDIGKISIHSEILSKPGRLNSVEFSMIKMHSQSGYDIFKNVELPWPIAEIILQHHERLDGSGYPRGLKGKDIFQAARIIAVSDVVEAMSSHRPYRPALGIEKALEEISNNRGKLYDPDVVDVFISVFNQKGLPLPQLEPDMNEEIARAIHESYRKSQQGKLTGEEPAMAEWEDLPHYLKESNRLQAEHTMKKLSRIGCTVHRVTGRDVEQVKFTEDEIAIMAEMEHLRWNAERLFEGWRLGEEKDDANKITPYLVPFSELPEDVKEVDVMMVRNIPGLLSCLGLEIRRQQRQTDE